MIYIGILVAILAVVVYRADRMLDILHANQGVIIDVINATSEKHDNHVKNMSDVIDELQQRVKKVGGELEEYRNADRLGE